MPFTIRERPGDDTGLAGDGAEEVARPAPWVVRAVRCPECGEGGMDCSPVRDDRGQRIQAVCPQCGYAEQF
jgi:hypothetical protein